MLKISKWKKTTSRFQNNITSQKCSFTWRYAFFSCFKLIGVFITLNSTSKNSFQINLKCLLFFLRSYDKFIRIKKNNRLYLARVCLNFYERILSKSIVYENSYRYRKNTSTTQKNIVNMFEHKALTILRYQIGDTNISYPFRFRLIFSGIHDAAAVVSIASLKFENRFVYA